MRRHTPILMAALAMGLGVSATRRLEDVIGDEDLSDSAAFRLVNREAAAEPKVHKHSREIARRLRQKAKREAKALRSGA